jgi:Secretion system C-terminal sorting domain
MKNIIFLLIFTCTFSLLQAQYAPFYNILEPNPSNSYQIDNGLQIILLNKEGILYNLFLNEYGGRSIMLIKFDTLGKFIYSRRYDEPNKDLAFAEGKLIKENSLKYLLFTGVSQLGDYEYKLTLLKTNLNLDSIYQRSFQDLTQSLGGRSIQQLSDSTVWVLSKEVVQNSSWLKIFTINPQGEVVKKRIIQDSPDLSWPVSINKLDDRTYIICSGSEENPPFSGARWRSVFTKIDSTGDILWQKYSENETFSVHTPLLTPLLDGSFAWSWARDTNVNNPAHSDYYNTINGMDADGNFTWMYRFVEPGIMYINKLITATNGDIVGCGTFDNDDPTRGWIFRMAPDGQLLWQRHYYDGQRLFSPFWFNDIVETENEGLLLTGAVLETFDNLNPFLLSLNKNGCLNENCTGLIQEITDVTATKPQLIKVNIYPNPTSDFININFDGRYTDRKIEIFNSLGQLMQTVHNKEEIVQISVEKLPIGNYYLKILDKNGLVNNLHFIKQ